MWTDTHHQRREDFSGIECGWGQNFAVMGGDGDEISVSLQHSKTLRFT